MWLANILHWSQDVFRRQAQKVKGRLKKTQQPALIFPSSAEMDRSIARIFDLFEWLAQQTDYISAAITQQLYMTP